MHPILERSGWFAFVLYLGLWVLVGGLLTMLLAGRTGLSGLEAAFIAIPVASAYAFVCLSSWYVARGQPIVSTTLTRVLITGVSAAVLSSAVWLALSRGWIALAVRYGWLPPLAQTSGHESLIFGFGILVYLLSLAVSYLLDNFERTRDAERRALEVQVLAREAELRSLRSQIDPHFLFNCLHSISALTTVNPAAARRMCLLLGDFLRETIALGAEAGITVARELKLAERFLEVERIRFGDRLDVEIAAAPEAEACIVPPLLLQPIVENAVTHGIAHLLERGTIRITATSTPVRLSMVIENPCDADRPRGTGTGVGLANVRARLRTLHGTEASVSAAEREGRWRVEVSLPATTAS
jgi:two-component system, LytTR family, sensor histidine kinase AlgZ